MVFLMFEASSTSKLVEVLQGRNPPCLPEYAARVILARGLKGNGVSGR